MILTRKTRWRDIAPLIGHLDLDAILDKVEEEPLQKDILDITCGDFIGLLNQDSHTAEKVVGSPKAALVMLGRLKTMRRRMKEIGEYITANDYTQDSMVQKAAAGVRFPTPQERILLDVQQRYHLRSLDEAEKAPLTDYLLMVRDQTARAKFESNLQNLQKQKYNLKNKKK